MGWTFFVFDTLALLIAMIFLLRYYIHRKWKYFEDRNIPFETPSILGLGSLLTSDFQEFFTRDNKRKQLLGPVYGFYSGLRPIYIVHDIEIMRQIYTKEFKSFPDRLIVPTQLNGRQMSHGLTVTKDSKWKRLRTTLSPTFSISKLKQMFSIADRCTTQTVEVLKKKCETDNGKFVARTLFSNLSLDVIVTSALGANAKPQSLDGVDTELALELRRLTKTGFNSVMVFSVFLFPSLEWIYKKLGFCVFPKKSLDYLDKFLNVIIGKRRQISDSEKPKDLLQLMLDAEVPGDQLDKDSLKGISKEELIGNAMEMVGAGFENTANTMVFLAYNLAFHQDVQEKLQQEIDEVFEEKGCFEYETIQNMKYLDMCMNESLRLYNPILQNSRVCRKETTINGLTIPKNASVNIPVFGLSHDPEYWEEPWEFKPERMEDMSQIDPMVFQPFGAGPRNCIGMRFSTMEIKMTFCKLLHKFRFEPCDDTPKPPLELTFSFGIKPKEELSLRAVPRT